MTGAGPDGGSPSGFQIPPGAPAHYEAHVAPIMQPFVAALVEAAVGPGDRVIDVACGTGFATRAAAAAAGAAGAVAGVDVNPEMIGAATAGLAPGDAAVDWIHASAMTLPWSAGRFDAAICQQGLQFFPDPGEGLAEMARVTRAGGRIAATVWAPRERSPYLDRQLRMVIDAGGVDPTVADQAFPPGGEATLRGWAREGGLRDVSVDTVDALVELPLLRDYIPAHLRALPWTETFLALDAATRAAAVEEMIRSLGEYVRSDGTARIPFTSYLLVGSAA